MEYLRDFRPERKRMLPKGLLVTGVMLTIAGLIACFQGPRESGTTSDPETNPPIETPSSSEEGNGSGPQGIPVRTSRRDN